jgi:hypothetical protein
MSLHWAGTIKHRDVVWAEQLAQLGQGQQGTIDPEQSEQWSEWGYDPSSISWLEWDYAALYPQTLALIAKWTNLIPRFATLTCLKPGGMVPFRSLQITRAQEWTRVPGQLIKRYTIWVNPKTPGQVWMLDALGQQTLSQIPEGDCWLWEDWTKPWAQINLSDQDFWLLDFVGTTRL